METAFKEQLNDGLEKAKTASSSRFDKIREILGTSFPEIWAEVLAGAKELLGIGREVTTSLTDTAKTKFHNERQIQTEKLQQNGLQWLKTLTNKAKDLWHDRFAPQVTKLDSELDSRYGNTYQTAKQKVDQLIEFYQSSRSKVETGESTSAIEVPYQIMEDKAAQVGATIGEAETKLKQQLHDKVAAVLSLE
jgi:hypothetical protein